MNKINYRLTAFFLVLSLIILVGVPIVHCQQITRIAPMDVTLRGVSIADFKHVIIVGDSATILINIDTLRDTSYYYLGKLDTFTISSQFFTLLSAPNSVHHSTSFFGVSYYDPLDAIVVGDAGVILKTNDKGKTWSQPTSGVNKALRAITHITGSIFQIVGDGGTILRSTDYGVSWSNIPSSTTKALNAEAFGSNMVGLAAGEAGTMLKTIDGGLTWDLQTQAAITTRNFYGIAMLGEDTAIAVGDSALFRYTNDGKNWQTKKDSNAYHIAAVDVPSARNATLRAVVYTRFPSRGSHITPFPAPAAIAGGDGDILYWLRNRYFTSVIKTIKKQHDTIWTQFDTLWVPGNVGRNGDADGGNDAQQFRVNCIATYNTGTHFSSYYAGPHGQIFVNTDTNVSSWGFGINPVDNNFDNFLFASFDSTGHGYCTETGSIVRRTSDNGYTWKDVLVGKDVSGVYCLDSNTAFVAGWGGSLWRTIDGGVKWDSIPNFSQSSLHGFAFTSPTNGFCIGDGGTVLHTTDKGKTWETKNTYPSFFKAIAFSSPDTGVAVGDNGSMMRTTDGGKNWTFNSDQPLSSPDNNLRYIQAYPNGTYFVGADGGVMKSTDHGYSWTIKYPPPDSVGISFYNSKIGIVGLYSTSSQLVPDTMTLKYTTDGGESWSKAFNVPFYNIHRMLAHWLNDHTFLIYGIDGFTMKVDLQGPNAVTEIISPSSSQLKVYPNPSAQRNITIQYLIEKEGPVTIELYDELGKPVATLFNGIETVGLHDRLLTLSQDFHGNFFIRTSQGGMIQIVKMIKL